MRYDDSISVPLHELLSEKMVSWGANVAALAFKPLTMSNCKSTLCFWKALRTRHSPTQQCSEKELMQTTTLVSPILIQALPPTLQLRLTIHSPSRLPCLPSTAKSHIPFLFFKRILCVDQHSPDCSSYNKLILFIVGAICLAHSKVLYLSFMT